MRSGNDCKDRTTRQLTRRGERRLHLVSGRCKDPIRTAVQGRLRPVASRGWVGSGGFQRGGKGQSYVPLQVEAFDGAPPLTGCVKLFCRKISPRVELSYVCVDLYFSGVSFRVSPNL